MARARPEANVLAFEVYQPAIARILAALARDGVTTSGWSRPTRSPACGTWCRPESVDELWMFFPDPWHKSRHHKRRLVDPDFADLVASRLRPGGRWRLATDWADYAAQMRDGPRRATPAFVDRRTRLGRRAGTAGR